MSTNVLKIIPTTPQYVPAAAAQLQASGLVRLRFPDTEVNLLVTEETEFVDPGTNLEKIECPFCGTEIETSWWQQAMDAADKTKFTDLSVLLPCCGEYSSLYDLHYHWPAGFARFTLEIVNPKSDPDSDFLNLLEKILGSQLLIIWAHY